MLTCSVHIQLTDRVGKQSSVPCNTGIRARRPAACDPYPLESTSVPEVVLWTWHSVDSSAWLELLGTQATRQIVEEWKRLWQEPGTEDAASKFS